ncbi:hypothetical protein C8J56DRAFT_1175424 [Mycena floridula]|nr:hypothetical protein C8J56DRAFT_1175424 [Mycena floridula]
MISTKMTLGCRALSISLFCLPVLCLILDAPYGSIMGPSIRSNGLARIDWIPEVDGSDPVMFNIELKNNVTGDSYELAQHVATNLWTKVVPMTDVAPGHGYFIQAVNISHHSQVYNSTAVFTVLEATPSSSNPRREIRISLPEYFTCLLCSRNGESSHSKSLSGGSRTSIYESFSVQICTNDRYAIFSNVD